MKKLSIMLIAVVLLAACRKDDADLATSYSGKNDINQGAQNLQSTRPFAATINATADVNSSNPPTACSGDIPFAAPDFILSGTATHLGQLNAQISRLHHVSCNISIATMLLTTSVTVELSAANGDRIYCTGNDIINVVKVLTQTGTTGAITGTWVITGGTGRFNGASGSLNINGLVDFVTTSFNCEVAGTITY